MAKGHYTDNPSIHLDSNGKPHLTVMFDFFYDDTLPKWAKPTDEQKDLNSARNAVYITDSIMVSNEEPRSRLFKDHTSSTYAYTRHVSDVMHNRKPNGRSIWATIKSLFGGRGKPVEKVFEDAKDKMRRPNISKEIVDAEKSLAALTELIVKSGQRGLAEKVETYASVLKAEIAIFNAGYDKYLLEEDVIDFFLKSERGLSLTFLRYYSDIMPIEVMKKKVEVDGLMAFDNYCVLHYDPDFAPFRFIQEEEVERKRRDPILFGMVEGSNKLYYVTDWVYKDDDLTLAKLETAIGRKARQLEESKIAETNVMFSDAIRNMEEAMGVING